MSSFQINAGDKTISGIWLHDGTLELAFVVPGSPKSFFKLDERSGGVLRYEAHIALTHSPRKYFAWQNELGRGAVASLMLNIVRTQSGIHLEVFGTDMSDQGLFVTDMDIDQAGWTVFMTELDKFHLNVKTFDPADLPTFATAGVS